MRKQPPEISQRVVWFCAIATCGLFTQSAKVYIKNEELFRKTMLARAAKPNQDKTKSVQGDSQDKSLTAGMGNSPDDVQLKGLGHAIFSNFITL